MIFVWSVLRSSVQNTCETFLPTLPPSAQPVPSPNSDSCLLFATLSHFDLISIFLCNIALPLLEQTKPSSSLLSFIFQVLNLFTPSSNLHLHFSTFLPPSTLQNLLSEHLVEPLQTSCRRSREWFSRSDHYETLWKGVRDSLGPFLTFPTSCKHPHHFLPSISLCTVKTVNHMHNNSTRLLKNTKGHSFLDFTARVA